MIVPKNLLIVRTDRIGDVVLSLPIARIIKKYYPDCKVSFLVRNYTESIVCDNPDIDEIIILKEKGKKIALTENINQIKIKNFDSALVVYPTLPTAWIIYRTGIKHRVGTGYRWYSFLFNHKVFQHRKYAEHHELEFNIKMLTKFGIKESITQEGIKFNISVDSNSVSKLKTRLKLNGWQQNKKIIIIHPGSGGSSVDLSPEKFRELINKLSSIENQFLIITGSSSEKLLADKLTVNTQALNLAGNLNLKELIALISLCDIFISNSTGPIHIAAALDKYTIGFYPKIVECSARRWGPYSTKGFIFEPKIDCKNCNRRQCEQLKCMNSINTNDVLNKVNEIILNLSSQRS
jgi:lipopolysaccharide heptosyltransferase II